MELTDNRAKPAVQFGGKWRIIDFALSNAINSGIHRIGVATQYKAHSLNSYMQRARNVLHSKRHKSIDILTASQRFGECGGYGGTADAVFQNIDFVANHAPRYMVILAADHVYKMDYELMLQQHVNSGADVTVGCLVVPRMEATGFGVMAVDDNDVITSFLEKPRIPPAIPGEPEKALASMGIYVFDTDFLFDQLRRDAETPGSRHDFGGDVIPHIVKHGKVVAHRFTTSCVRAAGEMEGYWRDVGTLDAYFDANLDLTEADPKLNMSDCDWPIWNDPVVAPPKFVSDAQGRGAKAVSSLISHGCDISGAVARRSLLSTGVAMGRDSSVEEAVVLPYCEIGRGARLRRVIVDSGVHIPEGLVVGEEPELDARRFRRTENGVCLITKPMIQRLNSCHGIDRLADRFGSSAIHRDQEAAYRSHAQVVALGEPHDGLAGCSDESGGLGCGQMPERALV
ncbi:glucose-1-phosphate adenylyltransferase [Novosphingobium indicum]|uniref:Glucose-1-phosphate adenylyltransferase n=2 Tax=Novosphingobium indicum TaxID=462949 RepID=A0ABQ2JIC3_9SPHN|nr:glucose-1-phosphate adenylyltransferase [Novosphingobium indicum]